MRIDVLTTFPEMFGHEPPAALAVSIPGRARAAGRVQWQATDIRNFADNKHAKTDDRPFGGGPGMVMTCQPLWDAVMAVEALDERPAHRLLLSPQGKPLTQATVERLAALPRLVLICGHYEGIDERVVEKLAPEEISLGDYVLSGGELAAMVLMDAIIRRLPGVLGHEDSASQDSFSPPPATDPNGDPIDPNLAREVGVPEGARLLDCPHYTRPREWMGMVVPEVLLGGDHAAVARWRLEQRLARTQSRRPDLLGPGVLG
ncbi:MAG: tRNA (guanine(37)-N(1))-methyltransferase [Phycisphaeraceae bacterium]|nr:tRNA (guanine(37)-N(1))-methyltransferase [Phycisphaeraceae bacterium]